MEQIYREPPVWPKVIGGLSLGWGVLGLGCLGCGIGWFVLGPGMLPPAMKDMPAMNPGPGQWAQMAVSSLITILLITAGAMTCMRNPLGRVLHLIYGALSLPMLFWALIVQIDVNARTRQWLAEQPNLPPGAGGGGPMGEVIGYVVTAVMGLAYPVFILVWFGAIKHRKDAMTGTEE